jgi:hypothetical protein
MQWSSWMAAQLAASQEGFNSVSSWLLWNTEILVWNYSEGSRFEVLITAVMNSFSWDITSCIPLNVNRRFGRKCRLQLQSRRMNQARNYHEGVREQMSVDFQRTARRYISKGRTLQDVSVGVENYTFRWENYLPVRKRTFICFCMCITFMQTRNDINFNISFINL